MPYYSRRSVDDDDDVEEEPIFLDVFYKGIYGSDFLDLAEKGTVCRNLIGKGH